MKWLSIGVAMLLAAGAQAEIYKWKDEQGRVHYSDTPPPAHIKPDRVTPDRLTTVKPVVGKRRVVIFSTSWCGPCNAAKAYLKKQGIPFTAYDIEKSTEGRRKYDQLGEKGVPVILVDGQKMVGFNQRTFDRLYNADR